MQRSLFHNATLVTSKKVGLASIIIEDENILDIIWEDEDRELEPEYLIFDKIIDLTGKHIIAGGIDPHVHFREPGLTHKADMYTESLAALAGGVTTVIDMPNTSPATTSIKLLKEKQVLAKEKASCKMKFHIGATNNNLDEILKYVDNKDVAGIKVFMGSSTGNMLVDRDSTIEKIFSIKEKPILVHSEDEAIIKANLEQAIFTYGENIPFSEHENIRSRAACIKSSIKALELAIKHSTKLTLCHISTKEEVEMVRAAKLQNPNITAETSCNYLWFTNEVYDRLGGLAKCNPSIKSANDRESLIEGLKNGIIDIIGSDHAPHLLSEKENIYTKSPSGLPTIQQTLSVLLTLAKKEDIPLTRIASVFSEQAAEIYKLDTGKLAKGYKADFVIFELEKDYKVLNKDQHSKCGWTPYAGETLFGVIDSIYLNGKKVTISAS